MIKKLEYLYQFVSGVLVHSLTNCLIADGELLAYSAHFLLCFVKRPYITPFIFQFNPNEGFGPIEEHFACFLSRKPYNNG